MAADNKTQATKQSATVFLNGIDDKEKRADAKKVAAIMQKVTGAKAVMWGPSIVGFGQYHYRYESGREGDCMLTGLSPRKQALTIYVMAGFKRYDSLMKKLGKYKTGKSCLYVKRLSDIDEKVLEQLIEESVKYMRKHYDTR